MRVVRFFPFEPSFNMLTFERSKRSVSLVDSQDGEDSREDGKRQRHREIDLSETASHPAKAEMKDPSLSCSVALPRDKSFNREAPPAAAEEENSDEPITHAFLASPGSSHAARSHTRVPPPARTEPTDSPVGVQETCLPSMISLCSQMTVVPRPSKHTTLSQEEWMQLARLKPKVEGVCFDRFFKRWVAKRAGMKKVYFPVYKYGFDLAYDLAVRTRRGQEIDPSLNVPAFVPAGPRRPRKPSRAAVTSVAKEDETQVTASEAAAPSSFRASTAVLPPTSSSSRDAEKHLDACQAHGTTPATLHRPSEREKNDGQRTPERCSWQNIRWTTSGGETSIESEETWLSSSLSLPRTSTRRKQPPRQEISQAESASAEYAPGRHDMVNGCWSEDFGDTEERGLLLSVFSPNQVDTEDGEATANEETGFTCEPTMESAGQELREEPRSLGVVRAKVLKERGSKEQADGGERSASRQVAEGVSLLPSEKRSREGTSVACWGGTGLRSTAKGTNVDAGEQRSTFEERYEAGLYLPSAPGCDPRPVEPSGDVLVALKSPEAGQSQATDCTTQGTRSTCSGDGSVSGVDVALGMAGDEISKVSSVSPTPQVLMTRSVSPQPTTAQKRVADTSLDALVKQLLPLPPGTHFDWPSKKWFAVYRCCPHSPAKPDASTRERRFCRAYTGRCLEDVDRVLGNSSPGPRWGERRVRIFDPAKYGDSVLAAFRACRGFCRTARQNWLHYIAETSQQHEGTCSQESRSHGSPPRGGGGSLQKDGTSSPETSTGTLQTARTPAPVAETASPRCADRTLIIPGSSPMKRRATLPGTEAPGGDGSVLTQKPSDGGRPKEARDVFRKQLRELLVRCLQVILKNLMDVCIPAIFSMFPVDRYRRLRAVQHHLQVLPMSADNRTLIPAYFRLMWPMVEAGLLPEDLDCEQTRRLLQGLHQIAGAHKALFASYPLSGELDNTEGPYSETARKCLHAPLGIETMNTFSW